MRATRQEALLYAWRLWSRFPWSAPWNRTWYRYVPGDWISRYMIGGKP